mmetsp:Transcript_30947/g.68539  ORF Transcript_30947/g.68539 Transcript_30947/m.68539 type:complete len:258 (+) Transcript_30947:2600-3373(+)
MKVAAVLALMPDSVMSSFSLSSVMVGSSGVPSSSGSRSACALRAATSKFHELTPFLYSSCDRAMFLSLSDAVVAALPCLMSCTLSPREGMLPIRCLPRYSSSLAALKNLCSRSCAAVGRRRGSFCRHLVTTSLMYLLKCFLPLSSSVGGGFCRVISSTFMGGNLANGACPCAISSSVIPNDQMSAALSYPSVCSITSGAIQHGVPTKVILVALSWPQDPLRSKEAATPKSPSLTDPSLSTKMLPALISLWMPPCLCT